MVSGLIGVPNLGIETRISRKSSIQLDVLGSFWNSFLERPLQVVQIFSEYRYYPKGKFNNLYLGSHIGFGMFSITRLNEPKDIYHSGKSTFIGLSIGYKKKINSNFKLDFFIGGGASLNTFRSYSQITNKRTDISTSDNSNYSKSTKWFPYRGGVMLVYSLN